MVRIVAGTLVEFGIQGTNPEKMLDILEAKDRKKAGKTAPSQGLYLVSIDY